MFVNKILKIGDIVRVTTKEAMGVIGKVLEIDLTGDGLVLKEVTDPDFAAQIDNPMKYDKALFTLSEIKYLFVLDLTKPIKKHGSNDSQPKI